MFTLKGVVIFCAKEATLVVFLFLWAWGSGILPSREGFRDPGSGGIAKANETVFLWGFWGCREGILSD
jgi:hypothetical protein